MKVERSAWEFAPRRWISPPSSQLETPDPDRLKQHQLDQLRAEHPWMSRSVEVMQMGSWVAHEQSKAAPWSQASAALSGVTAVASAVWGVNKLARGQSGLDRVEGLGHLALAADYSMCSLQQLRPELDWTNSVATPSSYLAASCEVFLGCADLVRGLKEDDHPRQWTGMASIASGTALAVSTFVPGASGLAQAAVLMSMAVRQSLLGYDRKGAG
ncbi:hypothetical protein IV102_18710 [bacterium]|nr:hypothetical protein [bacterium]